MVITEFFKDSCTSVLPSLMDIIFINNYNLESLRRNIVTVFRINIYNIIVFCKIYK